MGHESRTMAPYDMKPFIRITEVWLPSEDATLLEFGGSLGACPPT